MLHSEIAAINMADCITVMGELAFLLQADNVGVMLKHPHSILVPVWSVFSNSLTAHSLTISKVNLEERLSPKKGIYNIIWYYNVPS